MRRWIPIVALVLAGTLQASNIEVHTFDNPQQEADFKALTQELRCLVCQNQNIADSNAELAQDMRRKTYELLRDGKSKDEVADYMAERYGDFVLYKPRFNASTAVLWIGPFVLLFIGIGILLRTIRKQRAANATATPSQAELEEAAKLLDNDKKSS